ncbi:protein IQ-DOMAIN 1-like [Iris pallida]|uniref:Protein IQ-DOMAIN 1-like n=1 Tax=Iris pallida TaxID=29817 RepID=A0AAX6F6E2_IRIPA|nr:protein IQ-DOMAIN 1-like [Iris pallida]KAJ6812700.1 protein IQ-DOMAIN 1-like [Iris pallida]
MGRKGKWFGAVKKVFSSDSKEKKDKKAKKLGLGKAKDCDPSSSEPLESASQDPGPPHPEEVMSVAAQDEQSKASYSVAAAAETSRAAAEVVRTTAPARFVGKSDEETAAIKIQTAFRGYLARRALRALRGLVRLKSLIHGNSVKRQATNTLRCMQTLARVQSQVRSRRIRMSEENQTLQRQLLLKREKELESLRMGDEWDDSLQSKEQIEASLLSKQEAAVRRERALAYAFTHQGKNSSRSANPMFMDPNNPHWGWSWLERWMAARPWESRSSTVDKDLNSDRASVKSAATSVNGGEITKSYARRDSILDRTLPTAQKPLRTSTRNSPSTPQSKPPIVAAKVRSASPRMGLAAPVDDETRSMASMSLERISRRHSIAGSSVGDDESLAGSPAVPSYMAPTQSTRARSRFQSPSNDTVEGLDKVSAGSAKKRLSFPVSPASGRRHSGPPKVDLATVKDVTVQ